MVSLFDRGVFPLKQPYSDLIADNVILTVDEIVSIQSMEDKGLNPLANVFEIAGLTDTEYNIALHNKTEIVVFKDDSDKTLYVPMSYIAGRHMELAEYTEMTLGVNLGLLPKGYDTTALEDAVVDVLSSMLGLVPKSKTAVSSNTIGLDEDDSETVLARLRANNMETCQHKLARALEALDSKDCVIENLKCNIS